MVARCIAHFAYVLYDVSISMFVCDFMEYIERSSVCSRSSSLFSSSFLVLVVDWPLPETTYGRHSIVLNSDDARYDIIIVEEGKQ